MRTRSTFPTRHRNITSMTLAMGAFGAVLLGTPATAQSQWQDPIWAIGNQAVVFPQGPEDGFRTMDLPRSYHPEIPDAYEYQGQIPQWTQSVQCDENGNVLFFLIDGNVYNHDGLLIGDAAPGPELSDEACHVCLLPGVDVCIVPVPGSCTQYYIISAYQKPLQNPQPFYNENRMRVAILDLTLPSDLPVYDQDCEVPVMGRFLWSGEHGLGGDPSLVAFGEPVLGELAEGAAYAFDRHLATVQDGPMYFDVIELQGQDRHLMVMRVQHQLHMFFIDGTTITHWDPPGPADHYPFLSVSNTDPFPVIYNVQDGLTTERGYRGQLVASQLGSTLQVAFSSYLIDPVSGGAAGDLHQLRVTYWEFSLPAIGAPASIGFPMVPGVNPRSYSLDTYPIVDPPDPPLDAMEQLIPWPAIGGLQFSPNGQYLYFTKSTHLPAATYPLQPESNFGYIDLTVPCTPNQQPPCNFFQFMPIATPEITRGLADTRMGINTGPDGTGTALYMILSDWEGNNALAALNDPDQPDPGNWSPSTIALGSVTMRTDPSNQIPYRQLDRRVKASTHATFIQEPLCCHDMVKSRDRSSAITSDCEITWQPGDNAFWNTTEPVYIASELRIADGAHVTAQNMEFRFAEDAVLIIEPGASLTCTNCLFTNACEDTRWLGIEVHGNSLQSQYPVGGTVQQGKLVLRGSTVQNAEIGILVASRQGYKFTTGGIVQASRIWYTQVVEGEPVSDWKPTTIRNCREGVKYYPYKNIHPVNYTHYRNLGSFTDCVFTVDDEYPVDYDFLHHVWLWNVDGLPFTGCTFENTLPDAFFDDNGPNPGSAHLGHGIYSLDANFRVSSACNQLWPAQGPPCPEAETRRSTFTGLDHGIHALKSIATIRTFSVDRAQFTNNICGVYADGVINYQVLRSKFNIGGRNVTLNNFPDEELWEQRHRGIFGTQGWAFAVDYNELVQEGDAPTEGIVIGYSWDHNDIVFHNVAEGLESAYIGEGICVDENNKTHVGLWFLCNENEGNEFNFTNRVPSIITDQEEIPKHTIRLIQGWMDRPADNTFDRLAPTPAEGDFKSENDQNVINYCYDGQGPQEVDPIGLTAMFVAKTPVLSSPADNCSRKMLPITTPPVGPINGMAPGDVIGYIVAQKLAYGNTRYLYDQLIDGGSTDNVVAEIMGTWPQDAWQLHAYLMDLSPYLSTEALKEMVLKGILPAAMVTEILVANPEATRQDGFLTWLQDHSGYPLPEYMLGMVVASWEQQTYRSALQNQMAGAHGEMTLAANQLMHHYLADTLDRTDSLLLVWQLLPTVAARYAEAAIRLQQEEFQLAEAIMDSLARAHRLSAGQEDERQRMLALIGLLEQVHGTSRDEAELDSTEVQLLVALVDSVYDRPATWASNLLCFHYGICRTPSTGGSYLEPKMLPYTPLLETRTLVMATLRVAPNPATAWASFTYDLGAEPAQAMIQVLDAAGRKVHEVPLGAQAWQVVWDTRSISPGVYTVMLSNAGRQLASEKLIVQP